MTKFADRAALVLMLVALVAVFMALVTSATAHESGHVYSTDDAGGVERLPTTANLCGTNAGKVARYYNVAGTGADDNDLWARRNATGNSWLVRIYASKANLENTDLIHVKTYIRSLTC
jgi:hypothetical protein